MPPINNLSSQHIRRICRGESKLKKGYLCLINGDGYSGRIGVILADYVCDIVYVSRRMFKGDDKFNVIRWGDYVCNINSNNPIFYFICHNNHDAGPYIFPVYFLIGVRLDDLIRVFLNNKIHSTYIWGVGWNQIFRTYLNHLKRRFELEGIKFTQDDFRGIRLIDNLSMRNTRTFYFTIANIFTKLLKRLSNGKQC